MIDLREKLRQKGISPYSISKSLNIHHRDIYNFLNGNRRKVGKLIWQKIKTYFITNDFLPSPKSRKPSACRNCGLQYPTRKPKEVHAAVTDQGRSDFLPPSSGQNNNSDEPSQSESVKNPFTPAA